MDAQRRVEELVGELGPPGEELAAALMELYGEGLERIFAAVDEEGTDALRRRLVDDGVVASLMLMHGLYPVALETRVQEALDSVRPYMETHGGDVELLGVADGVARIRLEGSCHGCGASSTTLELGIKQALEQTAPDLVGLEVEGAVEEPLGLFELPMVQSASPVGWQPAPGLAAVGRGQMAVVDGMVVANLDGDLLAYRDACAACGASLADAMLEGATLSCAACSHSFELRLAGRSSEGTGLQLEPVPLLREDGEIRIAGVVPPPPAAHGDATTCELCPIGIGDEHKHLIHLGERRILCVCASCWALRSGDGDYRPVGNRTVRLEGFSLSDEQWAAFQIPIGLAFFMISSVSGSVIALYPSPAGATESELDLDAWRDVVAANPGFELEPDTEALIVNRLSEPAQHVIAPIDAAYGLVGVVKSSWEGISGGASVTDAVTGYLAGVGA